MRSTLRYSRELFWHYWLPVLTMLGLIRLESTDTMSGGNTYGMLLHVLRALGVRMSMHKLNLLHICMRKGGHCVGYALLCLSWIILLRGSVWLRHDYKLQARQTLQAWLVWWRAEWAALALLLTFAVASADELHQMRIPSRGGSWWDVALDTTAGLLMLGLLYGKARWHCRARAA